MNKIFTHLLSITALILCSAAMADVVPYIAIRSQGFNAAREIVGWQDLINRYDMDCVYGAFSITPEYTRTFKGDRLAQALFCDVLDNTACNSHCSTFLVQGTKATDRSSKALMAENFYLPTDFKSEVTVQPRIDNFLVDLNFYVGLDQWCDGAWFRVHTPICHTRWNLNFCENIVDKGALNYDPGYFNGTLEGTYPNEYGINRGKMLQSFEEFIVDSKAITGVTDMTFNSLSSARIAKCTRTKTRPAEITAALGWNVVNRENGTLGFSIRAAAPTGNKPEACYLFEPIVGNGHHWELGGGINSRWCIWKATDECDDISFYCDANVTHLFKTRQCRTFDLSCKPLSRYMLAMKFTDDVNNLLAGSDKVAPNYQFASEYIPVANLTTFPVHVSAAVQGDVVCKFAYTHSNFQFDLGYNFWARSCLKITKLNCCQSNFSENSWALKGDSFTFGFNTTPETDQFIADSGTALSATQNGATIYSGKNQWPNGIDGTDWNQNPGIDNPQEAYNNNTDNQDLYTKIVGDETPTSVNTSLQPVFITEDDFNIDGARTKGMSNKVFTNFGYIWKDRQDWQPFLGIGAEVEFGSHDDGFCCSTNQNACEASNHCNKNCNSCCKTVALSQWGVWVKGGVAFD